MSSSPAPASAPEPRASGTVPRTRLTLLFAALMTTMLLAALSQMILSAALPTMVGELGGVDHMSWVITAYILASTIMMPIYGRISDLFGRKPILLLAILLFIVGSLIGTLAGSMTVLIAARVVQGLGGGGLMILAQATIADVVPARERGKYMGYMGAVFAVSSVAGPMLGGWLTEGPGWRWAFIINIPLGLLAILAVSLFLRIPRRARPDSLRIDYPGMILLATATTSLILVCTWGGNQYDWFSPQILTLAAVTVLAAIAFVVTETKVQNPVIPLALFSDRNFTLTTTAGLVLGVVMFGAVGYMPTYIQMAKGVDATAAGLLMTPMMGSLLLTSIVAGQIVSRTGRYKLFPLSGMVIAGVGLWLMSTMNAEDPIWQLCVFIAIFGAGIGLSMQILVLIVQNSFPNRIVGTATAASNFFRQVGATVGSAVVGSLFVARLQDLLAERMPQGAARGPVNANSLTPESVQNLPDALRTPVIDSYNDALLPIFLFMVPLTVIALILLLFVVERPLATSIDGGESAAGSTAASKPATAGQSARSRATAGADSRGPNATAVSGSGVSRGTEPDEEPPGT